MVNLDYSFRYGDAQSPQTPNNKAKSTQSSQDNVWEKPKNKFDFDGYNPKWTDPDVCRKNPGTCPNVGDFYESSQGHNPKELVKELWQINQPTRNGWITPLTDCELIRKSRTISPEVAAYNKKMGAPSPQINIRGVDELANIVVKKSNYTTYLYDESGKLVKTFKNAIGASGKDKKGNITETPTGIRYVTGISKTPYTSLDDTPKMKEDPGDYGPFVIKMRTVDTDRNNPYKSSTGHTRNTGVFLHGTRTEWYSNMGKKVSHGCIRQFNGKHYPGEKEGIEEIVKSGYIQPGDYINVIN